MVFRFSLAAVLRVRLLEEEREERLLQQILQEIAQTQATMSQVDTQMARANLQRADHVHRRLEGREMQLVCGSTEELRSCKADLAAHLEKLDGLRDKQMAVYLSARRSREMLAGMEQSQRIAHDAAAEHREQKALDDIFTARHSRRRTQY